MPSELEKVSLERELAAVAEPWRPRVVARLNGQEVKLVKLEGDFVWHKHDADELFSVLRGRLRIELRDGELSLGPGEMGGDPARRGAPPDRRRGGGGRALRAGRGGQHRRRSAVRAHGVVNAGVRRIAPWIRAAALWRLPRGEADPFLMQVTVIPSFGAGLRLNLHFHTTAIDGVFTPSSDGEGVVFAELPPPTKALASMPALP